MDTLPDIASLQLAAVWTSVVAGVVGLAAMATGLFSVLTGRDHWPHALLRLRRRTPASEEDQRRNGLSLALNGAAALIVVMGTSINNFTIGDHTIGEPLGTLRFVLTVIGLAGALGCVVGSYAVSVTVKYTYRNLPAEGPPPKPSI
ncbi:MAG TPA: hypothetical protein VG413_07770 [Candidatus Dormibacteraeota bacterium]|jgi:uncharacterized membrane protein YbhN (UPF0104 family)|nr:hypothetical protein [Candidatus Dormibacteraeota bacterium]